MTLLLRLKTRAKRSEAFEELMSAAPFAGEVVGFSALWLPRRLIEDSAVSQGVFIASRL